MTTATSVSLCVILIEVANESPLLPSLHYLAPKYRNMSIPGKSELVFVTKTKKGEERKKGESRGKRDLNQMTVETYSVEGGEEHPGGARGSSAGELSDSSEPNSTDIKKIPFHSGNNFVEITKGILHLYKENDRTPLDKSESGRSDLLLMIAVPSSLSCRDLLQYVAPFQSDIQHIKIIRDSIPNQYMVLINFKSQKGADTFYQTLNGSTFNSFEEDLCNLAYVARVETMKESENVGLPLLGHTELPICPVCLERMDESVDGVLTILCNHSFHSLCLSKWSDARCPVCRFVQTPELVAGNKCIECKSTDSLWICLICGNIGCGRYVEGHAYQHFCETSHCYAIQPDNNRVWDYVGDNFVHRLLQNKDGKMVEVSGRPQPRLDDSCEEAEDKVDSMQLEFTYLLTTQLESQRFYFEEKLASQSREMQRELEKLHIRLEEHEKYKEDTDGKLAILSREKKELEKKISQLTAKLAKVQAEYKDELEMNKHLKQDHDKWTALVKKWETQHEDYVKKKTEEINDLKEQLRDVMFYIEGQRMVEESPLKDELTEGQVTIGPAASTSTKREKRRGGKR